MSPANKAFYSAPLFFGSYILPSNLAKCRCFQLQRSFSLAILHFSLWISFTHLTAAQLYYLPTSPTFIQVQTRTTTRPHISKRGRTSGCLDSTNPLLEFNCSKKFRIHLPISLFQGTFFFNSWKSRNKKKLLQSNIPQDSLSVQSGNDLESLQDFLPSFCPLGISFWVDSLRTHGRYLGHFQHRYTVKPTASEINRSISKKRSCLNCCWHKCYYILLRGLAVEKGFNRMTSKWEFSDCS